MCVVVGFSYISEIVFSARNFSGVRKTKHCSQRQSNCFEHIMSETQYASSITSSNY